MPSRMPKTRGQAGEQLGVALPVGQSLDWDQTIGIELFSALLMVPTHVRSRAQDLNTKVLGVTGLGKKKTGKIGTATNSCTSPDISEKKLGY